jgi:hypothetical protein
MRHKNKIKTLLILAAVAVLTILSFIPATAVLAGPKGSMP